MDNFDAEEGRSRLGVRQMASTGETIAVFVDEPDHLVVGQSC
jgi:hypothetical protein|nr:hypothetical protein [Streptomyces incarnatus]